MGWWGGEWIEGSHCEDAPCCGCCGPGTDDPAYHGGEAEPYEPDDYLSDGGPYDDGFDGPGDEPMEDAESLSGPPYEDAE